MLDRELVVQRLRVAVPAALLLVFVIAVTAFVFSYPTHVQNEANEAACEDEFGSDSVWVAGPDEDGLLICTTDNGLDYTEQPDRPPLLDWENFLSYLDEIS